MSTKKTKINILFYISQCPFILSKPRVRDNSALGLQVCLAINNEDAEYFWHEEHQVPNIVWDNDQWLGFDDPTSLVIKVKLVMPHSSVKLYLLVVKSCLHLKVKVTKSVWVKTGRVHNL